MQRNKILCFFATIMIAAVTIYAVFSRRRGIFWTACREYQGCIGSGDCTFLYQYVWLYLFEGEALREIVFHMGYPTKHRHAFCIFRSGYLFFCNHTISIGRTACQCVFYDKRWDSDNDRYGSIACKSDHVHVSGNFHRCVLQFWHFQKYFLNFSVICKIFIVSGIIVLSVLAVLFYLLLRKQEILKKNSSLAGGIFKEDSLRSCC